MFLAYNASLGQNIDRKENKRTDFALEPDIGKSAGSHLATKKYQVCKQMHPETPVLPEKLSMDIHKTHANHRKTKIKRLSMN